MNKDGKIKAVLFDSGRVLNVPSTGHWFISPNFFKYANEEKYKKISKIKINNAFKEAGRYINKQNFIKTEEDEFKCFIEFYSILSKCLPELGLMENDIESIAKDLVYNRKKYKFFDDVKDALNTLSKKYKLAIVSDAWPSLEGVFVDAGLRGYFTEFVISSQVGITKPNSLIFEIALERLNIKPHEAVFVDDNAKNCEGARNVGIKPILIARHFGQYIYYKMRYRNYKVVHDLKQELI